MLNMLLLEAILYLYIFSYQYNCNFIGQKLLSKYELNENTMACTGQ